MKTHGKSKDKLYHVWNGMKQRCYNANDDFYYCYGGKGITVCEEWKNSFQNFYDWAISHGYDEKLSIDRIDVNGNYCPENCRWTNSSVQNRNRADRKRYIYDGQELLLSEISEKTGIRVGTLWQRIQRGIPLEDKVYMNKKPVLVDETFLYESATQAAKSLNLNLSNLVMVCNGKRKSVKGHIARYLTDDEAAETHLAELKGGNKDE